MLGEWPAWAGPVSRMGLLRVIATAVLKEDFWRNFTDKRNEKA
jgi:hypothetical protein